MISPKGAWIRLAISGIAGIGIYFLVANTINAPVSAPTRSYTADFVDASGLHVDADVRVRGVRVGKVQSIRLERKNQVTLAAVNFSLDRRYGVVSDTRLAIKYQQLTGLRYIDVTQPAESYVESNLVHHMTTAMTSPSVDITVLFNGLQPVIATLDPDEINAFTDNAVSYLSGDGGGLAPMLDSIHKLSSYAADRQQVVSTLMQNLSELAASMGGHSKDLVQVLRWFNMPLDGALTAIDEFRKAMVYGPEFVGNVEKLLTNLGFPKAGNEPNYFLMGGSGVGQVLDMDDALDRAAINFDDIIDAVKFIPVMSDNIEPPSDRGTPVPCSRGAAQLPEQMDVLLNGRRVVLCQR